MAPQVTVLLGATAGLSVLGRKPTVTQERGQAMVLADGSHAVLTVHPSYLLRLPDGAERLRQHALFVEDLRAIRAMIERAHSLC